MSCLGLVVPLLLAAGPGRQRLPERERLRRILERRLRQRRQEALHRRRIELTKKVLGFGIRPRYAESEEVRERKQALARLKSPNPGERAAAAWWLGNHRVRAAWKGLVRLLKDPNAQVRANAVYALGRLGLPHLAPMLYDRLDRDKSPEVRGRAAVALGRLRYRRALPLVLRLLSADDPRLKLGAIEALGWMGSSEALSRLAALAGDKDEQVRIQVARALGTLGLRRGVRPLLRLLEDPRPLVVAEAVRALVKLRAQVLRSRLPGLLGHTSRHVKLAAVDALVTLGWRDLAEKLTPLFSDESLLVRARAALAGARLTGRAPADVLVRLLGADDNRIRVLAIRAAAHAGARWALPRIRRLGSEAYEPLRTAAAWARGWLEDPKAEDDLLGLLKERSQAVRRAALGALALVGGPSSLAACSLLLADPAVAEAAARCLEVLGPRDPELAEMALPGLGRLVGLKVRCGPAQAAAWALAALGRPVGKATLRRLARMTLHRRSACRAAAAAALGRVSGKSFPVVRKTLERLATRDKDPGVRAAAGLGLALAGRKEALRLLVALARRQDLGTWERATVLFGLAALEPGWRTETSRFLADRALGPPQAEDQAWFVLRMGRLSGWKAWLEKLARGPNRLAAVAARRVLGLRPGPVPEPPGRPARPARQGDGPAHGKGRPPRPGRKAAAGRPDAGLAGPFPAPKPGEPSGCGCRQAASEPAWPVLFLLVAFSRGRERIWRRNRI